MEILPGITMDASVRFGRPCIAGTRGDLAPEWRWRRDLLNLVPGWAITGGSYRWSNSLAVSRSTSSQGEGSPCLGPYFVIVVRIRENTTPYLARETIT